MRIFIVISAILATLIILSIIIYYALKDNNKLGHFKTNDDKKKYQKLYDKSMKLVPEPREVRDIETEYGIVRVYYFVKAENKHKTPILLIPGRASPTPMWEPNLPGLIKDRPVYTVDLLGEPGMSLQTKIIETKRQQAKWIHEILETLDIEKIHIVGASIGGWLSMNLERYFPEKVASISLLDPVFVFAPISKAVIILSIPAALPIIPEFLRKKVTSYITGGAKSNGNDIIVKLIDSGMKKYKIQLPGPDQFGEKDFKKIHCPVLAFMAGENKMQDSNQAVETARKYLDDIEIEIWEDASHTINYDYSEKVNNRTLNFIDKVDGMEENII